MNITGLGSIAAKGATVTLSIQAARFILQISGIVLLGRLLSPADFGLIVMVTAIIGIGEVVRDFGLMAAAVQAPSLSIAQKNRLFWLNSFIGFVLMVLCIVIAPIVSAFYSDPRLTTISYCLAITFLINGVQTQFQAHLTRSMKFKTLGFSDLAAQFSGLATAITVAILGFGYWALVVQLIVQPFVLLVVRATISDWSPGFQTRQSNIRSELRYGGNLMLTQTLVYVSSNIDSILIGSRFGAASAGLYSRAFQVLMMPLNQLFAPATAVALPILSKIVNESSRYQSFIERAQRLIIYPAVLLFSSIAAVASPLFVLAFGEVWADSATLFQILAFGGAFQAASYIGYWIFLSKGLTGSHFRYSLISRILLTVLVCVGATVSVQWVAMAYSVGLCLAWPFSLLWLRSAARIEVGAIFGIGVRALAAGVVSFAAGLAASIAVYDYSEVIQLVVGVVSAMVSFLLVVLVTSAGREDLRHIIQTAKLLRK